MKTINFSKIANDVLEKRTCGHFILRNGDSVPSSWLVKHFNGGYALGAYHYDENGTVEAGTHPFDVVDFKAEPKVKRGFLRFLFMITWMLEKIFYGAYFFPAFVTVLIVWAFVWFPYVWISGKFPSYRCTFSDVIEDTFSDVFCTILGWPHNLLEDFEYYVVK